MFVLCVAQVQASATGRSLVQRSPTVCVCVCVCVCVIKTRQTLCTSDGTGTRLNYLMYVYIGKKTTCKTQVKMVG
jgi:hypothetical protein